MLLALRSLLWTILLPGTVAGYLPWRFFGLRWAHLHLERPSEALGLLCIVAGTGVLATCIVEFARRGRGTLSPLDPPSHLVVHGLYRYVRNPMYLGVTVIVLGEALVTWSMRLAVYWLGWFAGANLFVIAYEEPTLRRQFGQSYEHYARRVGRWIPRIRSGEER